MAEEVLKRRCGKVCNIISMQTMSGASSFDLPKRGQHKCKIFVSKLTVSGEDSYGHKWAFLVSKDLLSQSAMVNAKHGRKTYNL